MRRKCTFDSEYRQRVKHKTRQTLCAVKHEHSCEQWICWPEGPWLSAAAVSRWWLVGNWPMSISQLPLQIQLHHHGQGFGSLHDWCHWEVVTVKFKILFVIRKVETYCHYYHYCGLVVSWLGHPSYVDRLQYHVIACRAGVMHPVSPVYVQDV